MASDKPSPVAWGIQIAMRRDEYLQFTSPNDRSGRFEYTLTETQWSEHESDPKHK